MTHTETPKITIMLTVEIDKAGFTMARFVDVSDVLTADGRRAVVASAAADLSMEVMGRIGRDDTDA